MKTKTYYVVELTKPGARLSRFALYEIVKGVLQVVWSFDDLDNAVKLAKLLPCQVYYPEGLSSYRFPAYHFVVGNVGYSKMQYLSEALGGHFKAPVTLLVLGGWAPASRL